MAIDVSILENLLRQEEGPALDFKEEQYLFENEDLGTKAELLKDILAMANSWRLTTAYILVGVREVRGGRSEVIGVSSHLDDAILHQFVNGKTQRPVNFSYLPFRIEGVEIGVIEIPLQNRPIYPTKRVGSIPSSQVLIRDGSSTRVATPDEIAAMGAEQALGGTPQFTLEWADVDSNRILPSPHAVRSLVFEPHLPRDTFLPRRPYALGGDPFANPDYSKEIILCTAERNLLTPLGFRLENLSGTVGKRVRFTGRIAKIDGLVIQEWLEELPSPNRYLITTHVPDFALPSDSEPSLSITEFDDHWRVVVDFGDVRPRDEVWTDSTLFVGSTHPGVISLEGNLRGDNLPEPANCKLEIHVDVKHRPMTIDDVAPYLDQE